MGSGDVKLPEDVQPALAAGDLEAMERLVVGIEDFLADALALLSEQDRALLVDYYGLEDVASGTATPPELHTDEARRVALRQARLRFSETLESLLTGAIQERRSDRQALEEALALVRGAVA
jgi:hypothetical protein